MPGPNLADITAAFRRAVPAATARAHPSALRILMYLGQLADAQNSARAFRAGLHETDPLMRPFSHGGALTMAAGFALGDMLRDYLLRRASQGTKNTADAAQLLLNLSGIAQTDSALRGMSDLSTLARPPSPPGQ